jgi:hypothetical protein
VAIADPELTLLFAHLLMAMRGRNDITVIQNIQP